MYTVRGKSRVANIAQGKIKCYIRHETLTKCGIYVPHKPSGSALSGLLYFSLILLYVLTKCNSLIH